ncbi:hypothetical protein ACFP1Z_14035 [Streptomyces gamaensis]|uniref:Uncharacterized protein n=1 Tax=Streptomyces gamaensis TaxID=1763542 RepID=A0ABW0YYP7_9ACTN
MSAHRKRVEPMLWIAGAVVVVAVAVTAWWRWDDRMHHDRKVSGIGKVWVSGDGRTVSVAEGWFPHCGGARPQLAAQESPASVVLTLRTGMVFKAPCEDERDRVDHVDVRLHAPLGGRRLIDAATGDELTLGR